MQNAFLGGSLCSDYGTGNKMRLNHRDTEDTEKTILGFSSLCSLCLCGSFHEFLRGSSFLRHFVLKDRFVLKDYFFFSDDKYSTRSTKSCVVIAACNPSGIIESFMSLISAMSERLYLVRIAVVPVLVFTVTSSAVWLAMMPSMLLAVLELQYVALISERDRGAGLEDRFEDRVLAELRADLGKIRAEVDSLRRSA